ncbi:MAG: LysM peptidoglycan-binding domain-containing protein [Deltaproteobacteria bacterium]|nr:MAG: LysM peptidoglycan-binding domain-containing protein [Deltaproteobacteria bacterium]
MRTRVDFWKKVYTEISTSEAFIHDTEDLSVIYGKIKLSSSRRGRINQTKDERYRLRKILRTIADKGFRKLTSEEQKIADIVGNRTRNELYRMSNDIRFQYGLSDRYYEGLIRSYAYLEYIEKIFEDLGLPHELTYLPHVESSFNYEAYSKVGAAGIWQFMRSTARLYKLKVTYIIDERRDPIKATKAAARFLKDNYKMLNSWPLALTAYNHGPLSMKRAINKLGTTDINTIIDKYEGRRFGFASKNFYATFMATVEISEDPSQYFPKFKKPATYRFSEIALDKPFTVSQLAKVTGLSKSTIRQYNHSIRRSAYKNSLYLPRGFVFRVPQVGSKKLNEYKVALNGFKTDFKEMEIANMHIVSRGENLFDISRSYRVSMSELIQFNQISDPSKIYPGMKLNIPGKDNPVAKIEPKIAMNSPAGPSLTSADETLTRKTEKKTLMSRLKKIVSKKEGKEDGKEDKKGEPSPLISLFDYELDLRNVSKDVYEISIETEETLGHFAEWAGVRTQRIRDLNRLAMGRVISMGQKIRIPISESKLNDFKQKRNEYHVSIQEDFYANYNITETKKYNVKRGDTLSEILKDQGLPYWLYRKYQKKKMGDFLQVGQEIVLPEVEEINPIDES